MKPFHSPDLFIPTWPLIYYKLKMQCRLAGLLEHTAGFYINRPAIKYFKIFWGADNVVLKIFHFVFVFVFNVRPSLITLTHNQLKKHTLSLKSSPNSAPGPARMHGPCRQTRKAVRVLCLVWVFFFFPQSIDNLLLPWHLLKAYTPSPPPTHTPNSLPRQFEPKGAGAGEMGPPEDSKPALTKDKHK